VQNATDGQTQKFIDSAHPFAIARRQVIILTVPTCHAATGLVRFSKPQGPTSVFAFAVWPFQHCARYATPTLREAARQCTISHLRDARERLFRFHTAGAPHS